MTNRQFRKATIEDLSQLVRLLADDNLGQLRESSTNMTPYEQSLLKILSMPHTDIYVIAEGKTILAMGQLYFLEHLTHQGSTRGQIEGLRVAESHRGQSLGKELILGLVTLCKEHPCHMVQLTTNTIRIDALNFYKKLGFENTHHGLKLML